jgi:hypothetical protein
MTKLLTVAALAGAVLLANAPAFAQSQGSNQAGDDALNWAAAGGRYGSSAYAQDYGRYSHRRHWR